ncbi:GNAT family N-acetyltransferase [Aurantivibrio plasticivorans]
MDEKVKTNFSLEQLAISHASELYDLTIANRDYLREWLPWLDSITSSTDTINFIESTTRELEKFGAPHFAVFHEGAICGVAGFHQINSQHRTGSIGYWLAETYVGKGIITTAVKDLLKIGFCELNLNRIEIRCAENNSRSRAIPERLGFTYEATLRECEWLYSQFVNHAIYSMLASDYKV